MNGPYHSLLTWGASSPTEDQTLQCAVHPGTLRDLRLHRLGHTQMLRADSLVVYQWSCPAGGGIAVDEGGSPSTAGTARCRPYLTFVDGKGPRQLQWQLPKHSKRFTALLNGPLLQAQFHLKGVPIYEGIDDWNRQSNATTRASHTGACELNHGEGLWPGSGTSFIIGWVGDETSDNAPGAIH